MRHVAAYLLATLSVDATQPTSDKIKAILGSVGVEADEKQLEIVLNKFANKSPVALIEEGSALLASMPSGGGAPSAGVSASTESAKGPAKVEKKEEKKEEPEEESDEDMGFGLFD